MNPETLWKMAVAAVVAKPGDMKIVKTRVRLMRELEKRGFEMPLGTSDLDRLDMVATLRN